MSIRLSHKHEDGKQCFAIRRHLEKCGLFRFIHPVTFKATTVAGAFMGYTGSYYLYDMETGREVAHIPDRKFFEEVIEPYRTGNLTIDPDCKL